MQKIITFLLVWICSLCSLQHLQAQEEPPKLFLELGMSADAYRGDLQNRFRSWGRTFHIGAVWNKDALIAPATSLSIGRIQGSNHLFNASMPDSLLLEGTQPNRSFYTNFVALQAELRIQFLRHERYTLYIAPGIGLLNFTPRDDNGNALADQNNTRNFTEIYNSNAIMLPIRIGGHYIFENGFGFAANMGFLNPFTDYLDNISELGNPDRRDQVLSMKFSLLVPIR
ncbi:MAG: hypothetical protein JJT94_05985 [Bernardetiaceae bacterium]|nr:hypothetical protein [Bernardetiaceae bacterium]